MELGTIDTVYNIIIVQLREPGSCKDLILKEENLEICAHLENILVHVIDMQYVAIFKSQRLHFRIYTLCTDVPILVGHILYGLYMQHYTCDNTDHILYKIPKDNASHAYSIYNYEHE